ncbi:MAG: hypothetical protein JWM25_231 [Thermoleophilia bacterium]|nr:hypothetical protein [Thermoleophilia bacterium]
MQVTAETTIQRPREEVYAAFADIPNAPERVSGIDRVEPLSDGPFAPGYEWRETRTMLGRQVTEQMQVTQTDAPASYRVESDSRGTHYTTDMIFTEADAGSTDVLMVFTNRPDALSARLLAPLGFLFAGTFRKLLRRDLEDLRTSLEGPG